MNIGYILAPLVAVVGIIYLVYKYKQSSVSEPSEAEPNAPIVENNYRKEFTHGYSLGHLKNIILRRNGCNFVEYFPMDVKQGEHVKRPPVQAVICREEFTKYAPRGLISGERERIKLLTRDPSKIPEIMRDTDEAKWEQVEGQKAFLVSTFKNMIPAGDEALEEALKHYARGNMPKQIQAEQRAVVSQIKKAVALGSPGTTEDKPK